MTDRRRCMILALALVLSGLPSVVAADPKAPEREKPPCHLVRGGVTHEQLQEICRILETGRPEPNSAVWIEWYEPEYQRRLRRWCKDLPGETLARYVVAATLWLYQPHCMKDRILAVCKDERDPSFLLMLLGFIVGVQERSLSDTLARWQSTFEKPESEALLNSYLRSTRYEDCTRDVAWFDLAFARSALGESMDGELMLERLRRSRSRSRQEFEAALRYIACWRDRRVFDILREELVVDGRSEWACLMLDHITNPKGPFARYETGHTIEDPIRQQEPPPPVDYWILWIEDNQSVVKWESEPVSPYAGRIGWWRVP